MVPLRSGVCFKLDPREISRGESEVWDWGQDYSPGVPFMGVFDGCLVHGSDALGRRGLVVK